MLNDWVAPASKRYRLREAGLWPAATPIPGAKYLTYFDAIEENGLNNQRQAFRNALAIARVLNRTLIMPRFHRRHRQESPVPMDYFFDVGRFEAEIPEVEPHHFLEEAFPAWETMPVQVRSEFWRDEVARQKRRRGMAHMSGRKVGKIPFFNQNKPFSN